MHLFSNLRDFYPQISILIYLLAGRLVMRKTQGGVREAVFAILNLVAVYYFYYSSTTSLLGDFTIYIGIVALQFLMLRYFVESGKLFWLAFLPPIAFLVVFKYLPAAAVYVTGNDLTQNWYRLPALLGISYQAFRCSRLALEVRNGNVTKPGFWAYMGFAFFLPTMPVGPINTFQNYQRGFGPDRWEVPVGRSLMRMLVGAIKYQIFGGILAKFTYSTCLLTGYNYHWYELPVVMMFYFLFLYCNFSGFCDMAIGAGGLIGIPVPENFNNPFAARNVKDFWNRWHITLSVYMRDVVFSPLSKFLVGKMGVPLANHAIALTITAVFLLVGIWHGVGWNFAAYGAVHALGVVANHYYTIFLKKRLGRDGFKAYNENRWIHASAVVLTFCYCGASLIFFANTFPQIRQILESLK